MINARWSEATFDQIEGQALDAASKCHQQVTQLTMICFPSIIVDWCVFNWQWHVFLFRTTSHPLTIKKLLFITCKEQRSFKKAAYFRTPKKSFFDIEEKRYILPIGILGSARRNYVSKGLCYQRSWSLCLYILSYLFSKVQMKLHRWGLLI